MAAKKNKVKPAEVAIALTIIVVAVIAVAVLVLNNGNGGPKASAETNNVATAKDYSKIVKSACAGIASIPGYIECNAAVIRAIKVAKIADIKYIGTYQYGRDGNIYYIFKITDESNRITCIRIDAKTGNADKVSCNS